MAQLASALAWGARGRPFKSDHPDNKKGQSIMLLFFLFMNMFTTYILFSPKIGKFYTGQTDDFDRRLDEHNRGKTPFMASGMPWELVFSKEFDSRQEAIKLERFIKKRGAARFLNDNI